MFDTIIDPKVRSEFAKEAQPSEVNFNAGETFSDVTQDKKPMTLKMTRAGILSLDPTTNVAFIRLSFVCVVLARSLALCH
jgi:hypothetical protein